MKKILVIGALPPPYNGITTATQYILSSLTGHFQILLLDIADRRGLANVGKIDVLNVYLALRNFIRLVKLLKGEDPDLLYIPIAQNMLGFLRDALFLIPGKFLGYKVVIHLHGGYFGKFYAEASFLAPFIRWALQDVRKAIVLGNSLRSAFRGIISQDRIAVIPNGVDPEPFISLLNEPRQKNDGFRVTYLGTLMQAKGFMEVLRAVPLVRTKVPNVRFILAGELCYRSEAEKARHWIEANSLANVVEMPGVVVGVRKIRLLLSSDIFVFPTWYPYEGHPFVILEAMAAGLPIITTDQGAIRETVIDGVNGFIVPKRDPKAVAEKIVLLLQDENLRQRMGQASRERFLKYYTLDRWARDMVRVFQEVIEEN